MKLSFLFTLCLPASYAAHSQSELPYFKIPDNPESYTASTVAARVIDGLGFRYYWATEGLKAEDLSYQPSGEARSSLETLQHIYELTTIMANTIDGVTTEFPVKNDLNYLDLREGTLANIKKASEVLKSRENIMSDRDMIFKAGENEFKYPFWNLLNGPISDALWHVGQVVAFRRSSGNPINPKAEVLLGRLLD
ncbi:MAG: hypothetical protein RLN86_03260 [Cyclobacteriaceae bacterium]